MLYTEFRYVFRVTFASSYFLIAEYLVEWDGIWLVASRIYYTT